MITRRTLLRLYFLGLGPHPEAFFGTGKEFSTMQEYRKEIGAESGYSPRGKFDDWTTQDFVNYAQTVEQIVSRKPTMTDYHQLGEEDPDVPTLYIITQRFKKGVSELNEHLGYPNTKNWEEDDYIDFGAKFVEVNGAALLKLPCITALSAKKRGPGYATIVRKFDSWDNFRAQAVAEYHDRAQMHKEERERKLTMYQTMIGQKILPASWAALPENDLLLYGARYMLSVKVRPEMTPNQRFRSIQSPEPHHFVRGLLRDNDRHTTPASIELEASIMGVYDDLWPMDQYKEYLKVTEAEVAAQITRRNQTKKRWYHTAQASASQA